MNAYVNRLVPASIQDKIKAVLNAFETGSTRGDYVNVTIFHDGKNNTRQITYGKTQTTEQGNLCRLIEAYIAHQGIYATAFQEYLPKIGVAPLADDLRFIDLLRKAGRDPVMQKTEDQFFDTVYYLPACNFFATNFFIHPLSLLVIYDSYIQSGGILPFLRNRFAERTPAYGGNEKIWIKSYLTARQDWLASGDMGRRPLLLNTVYRTHCLLQQINNDNWDLQQAFSANGVEIL